MPEKAEGQPPESAQRWQSLGAALVQPDDGGAQGLAVLIQVDQGGALGGQRHAGDAPGCEGLVRVLGQVFPELLAGLAERLPENLGLLLGQPGGGGEVGLDGLTGFGEQAALQVEDQRPHALSADVDG